MKGLRKGNFIAIPCTLVISDTGESYLTQPPSLGRQVFLFLRQNKQPQHCTFQTKENIVHHLELEREKGREEEKKEKQAVAAQIREQISGPDLHVFTLKFLALKKCFFYVFGVKKK